MSGIPIEIIKEMFPSLSHERIREISTQHPEANWDTLFDFYEQENRIKSEEVESIITKSGDMPDPLDPRFYKLNSCQDLGCSSPDCPNFHSAQEKRRDPCKIFYNPVPCTKVFKNGEWGNPTICSELCQFSHTHYEIIYHPSKVDEDLETTLEKREALLVEEINELKSLNNCNSCRIEEYLFICTSCYHTLCYLCRYKSDICSACKTEVRFIQRPAN